MYSAIWAYPWDFLDEGVDTAVGRIADAGLEGVSVAAAYHSVRALCPHNPHHAVVHGEGGVIYFRPVERFFAEEGLRPAVSALVTQQDEDPLTLVCRAAKRRGLKAHAWTVLHHNTRLGAAHPDCTLENAFGDRYPFGLCPANPRVRAYTLGIVQSLAEREELDTIELESLGYMGIDHSGHHSKAGVELDEVHRFLLSLCFCPHCIKHMQQNGVDAAHAREAVVHEMQGYFAGRYHTSAEDPLDVLADILGLTQAEGILAARDEAVLTLLEEAYWLIQERQRLSIMISPSPLATGAGAAVTLSQAREWTDCLLIQAFHRERSRIHEMVSDVVVRRGGVPVIAGLQAIAPFVRSAKELTECMTEVREAGVDGVQFYHYGLMPLDHLDWVHEALSAG